MTDHQIRYDLLTQDALRGVVRRVLSDVARDGLPGDHHFFISFRTTHPGVRISQRLRSSYPEEMTVVLQYQFWDLVVTDLSFEVGLAFGGIPERLVVPFDAITGFFDPSVQFGMKFEEVRPEDEAAEAKPAPRGAGSEPTVMRPAEPARPAALVEAAQAESDKPVQDQGSAEVVRLDTFRKKT